MSFGYKGNLTWTALASCSADYHMHHGHFKMSNKSKQTFLPFHHYITLVRLMILVAFEETRKGNLSAAEKSRFCPFDSRAGNQRRSRDGLVDRRLEFLKSKFSERWRFFSLSLSITTSRAQHWHWRGEWGLLTTFTTFNLKNPIHRLIDFPSD